jgi:hypothetical protein
MWFKIKLPVLIAVVCLAFIGTSCNEDAVSPNVSDLEINCLISEASYNGLQLTYLYDSKNRLIELNNNFGSNQAFKHVSDTVVEEGYLMPNEQSTRTRHTLLPNKNLKSITSETWTPQFGVALVQASVYKQDYIYLPNGNFSELITYEANYFIDSATRRPLGAIRLKKNGKTTLTYNADNNLLGVSTYYINADGSEYLSNSEEVTSYQTEEIGNAKKLSNYYLLLSGQTRNPAIGNPLKTGDKVPKSFVSNSGFSNSSRTFTFRLNESNLVNTIEEEIDTDFGFPYTNTITLKWICN